MWGFFKLISPFIDPKTREKLKFNEEMSKHVPREQLLKANGGDVDFEYDHSIYWTTFNRFAGVKKAEYQARWEKGGKRVGEYEDFLRGASVNSLAEQEAGAAVNSDTIPFETEKRSLTGDGFHDAVEAQ